MIVLEYAPAYGTSPQEARRLNAEEKKRYTEEWQNLMFVGISGTNVNLPFVHWTDLPDRDSDGAFAGCYNQARILKDEEVRRYKQINDQRAAEAQEKEDLKRREEQAKIAEREADKAATLAQFDSWTVESAGQHSAHHTIIVGGETIQFYERDFDFGVAVSPCYPVADGLEPGGMWHTVNGTRMWQTFNAEKGWYDVRPLTEHESICVYAIGKYGAFANSPIRM